MERRTYLQAALAAMTAAGASGAGTQGHPIQLYVDMMVDPAKEAEMLRRFHDTFKPTAAKHQGYINVDVMKLRSVMQGSAPAGANYRFVLTYQNEELRQKWVASADHVRVWPQIESTLANKNYTVLLFDLA